MQSCSVVRRSGGCRQWWRSCRGESWLLAPHAVPFVLWRSLLSMTSEHYPICISLVHILKTTQSWTLQFRNKVWQSLFCKQVNFIMLKKKFTLTLTCYLHFHSLYLIHSHFIYSRILQTFRCLAKWMLLIICKILWLNIYYLNYFTFVSLHYRVCFNQVRKVIFFKLNALKYHGINLVLTCNWLAPNIFYTSPLSEHFIPQT